MILRTSLLAGVFTILGALQVCGQEPDPGDLQFFRNRVGQTFQFNVTGSSAGQVFGTGVYTDDSPLATAAVHAGVVQAGEDGVVTVMILLGRSDYVGSTQNGVTSMTWNQPWGGSYEFAVPLSQFIVIQEITTGECRVVPEDANFTRNFNPVFGPASEAECQNWIVENCGDDPEPSDGLAWVSTPGNDWSGKSSISSDCRFVAFSSRASNLVPNDTNNAEDVFVYDRTTRAIERVSVASGGAQGNFESSNPSISADGRFVAFDSEATNLVPNDNNGQIERDFGRDVFVYDRNTDTIERVSLRDNGGEANQASRTPSISGDGRYVAFVSGANNLVSGFATTNSDVYVRDRTAGTIVGVFVRFSDFSTLR